ncbi:MAG: hypothetical protein ACI4DY_07295 [Monoglobaceae bacterium]
MKMVDRSFIPEKNGICDDYFCTWQSQADSAKRKHGDVRDVRNALNSEFLFSEDGVLKNYFETDRENIIVVLDDGWDVPYDASNHDFTDFSEFGSLELSEDRFPQFKGEPKERLKQLCDCIKNMGYKGVGVWVCANASGERDGSYLSEKEMREYWKTRAKWCDYAGIDYWKVDWGIYEHNLEFRKMLTETAHKYAPNVKVEHAVPQGAWHFGSEDENIIDEYERVLSVSDYFRTYDVLPNVGTAITLYRITECFKAYKNSNSNECILNVEDELDIAAALGCAVGIMTHPKWVPEKEGKIKALLNWHKLAPPFPIGATPVKLSERELTDIYAFGILDKSSWLYDIANGKTAEVKCPAIIARNTELPIITAKGEPPYVVCSMNPYSGAYSIGFLKRTVGGIEKQKLLCDAEIMLSNAKTPIGVFGVFSELVVRFGESIRGARLYIQKLDTEEAFDITYCINNEENCLKINSKILMNDGILTGDNGILLKLEK